MRLCLQAAKEKDMAMTKKEAAEVEALKTRLSLRFYPEIEPDIDIPKDGIVNGWQCNEFSARVEKACTSSISHNYGAWDKTTAQHPMRLYSTKTLAYKALLSKMAIKFACELRSVEKRMEDEDVEQMLQPDTTAKGDYRNDNAGNGFLSV
jgi:hypothetical protein